MKGGRGIGGQERWEDNIKRWTRIDFASSTRTAENRTSWKGIVAKSSVVPRTTLQGYRIEQNRQKSIVGIVEPSPMV